MTMARKRGPVFIELLGGQSARGGSSSSGPISTGNSFKGSASADAPGVRADGSIEDGRGGGKGGGEVGGSALWTRVTTDASGDSPAEGSAANGSDAAPLFAGGRPTRLTREAPAERWSGGGGPQNSVRGPIVVPMARLGWAVAALGLVVVLVWAVAYKIGETAGRRSIASQLESQDTGRDATPGASDAGVSGTSDGRAGVPAGPTRDPIASPPPGPTRTPPRATGLDAQLNPATPPNPGVASASGGSSDGAGAGVKGDGAAGAAAKDGTGANALEGTKPVVPGGAPRPAPAPAASVAGDPRQPATNYLVVATLLKPDAMSAVSKLIEGGVQAFAVPEGAIDPKSADANNRLWRVMALPGIPSGEWSGAKARRAELERLVKKIGRRWKEESRAPTDFSQTYWDLHRE